MEMSHVYWEENSNIQRVKHERCLTSEEPVRMKEDHAVYQCCDSNLNFSTATCSEDDCEYGPYKKSSKVARQDPMSHRIIEKRRRDRMNNCLADLSRLIPMEYLKKGRGRIEKTEIIEMAIKHMKHLQSQDRSGSSIEHYRLGYQEAMSEAMRFMVEVEGHFPGDPMCMRLLHHLQKHCDQISKAPATFPTSPIPEQVLPFPVQVPSLLKNGVNANSQAKVSDYAVPKAEPENSNSNDAHPSAFRTQKADEFEKDLGHGGVSYKYKTNIKLRFTQDLGAHDVPKRQKLDDTRRNSFTSFENQSSNQSSPPSSEPCTRISETEISNRQTPPDLSSNNDSQHKIDLPRNDAVQRFSPSVITTTPNDTNFNVPIFVLHTKGSYYIPLTIDYKTLMPYLQNYSILDPITQVQNLILHPVTINVNFLPNFNGDLKNNNNKCKYEFNNNWH
ncbi:transcription factor cwo isoform X1 [Dendroctonus ponderosae]|uniref:transcription factor cwo isoform X1 n=3 Tax=Dendroctonus ponderosae TaxID=77166 RepID=UPI002035165F|nr:transcription factor cwo isoform X1 [Dendroctonus ponderosae]